MKRTVLLFIILSFFYTIKCQEDIDKNLLPSTMFSIETGYHYSSLNGKNGVSLRTHVWFLQKNSIGPEFHLYSPSKERKYADYQFDFNLRRIVVDMHPLTFDFLIGPGFRSTRNLINDKGDFIGSVAKDKRYWSFDGINLGFGVGYRWGDHSIYGMPRITNKNASIQISLGYKFHFNITSNDRFNNKYKLRKKKRRS